MLGICAILSGCHRHPLLFPMHHQHLWIYLPFFLLSASTALWYAKILIAVLSFSPRSACKHSSQFYLCPMPFGQPTVPQPSQNRRNCSSTGAQRAEEGDKSWLLSGCSLEPLLASLSEEGTRKAPPDLVLGVHSSIL